MRAAALTALLPAISQACAVCFGGNNADMAQGFYWGVLLLLLLPFGLMAGLGGLFFYYARKHKNAVQQLPANQ